MPPKFGPVFPREERIAASLRQQMRQSIESGVQPRSNSSNYGQYLPIAGRPRIKLQKPDGSLTRQGRDYYDMMGINPPLLYSYEQPLINDKFVRAYCGNKDASPSLGHNVEQWQRRSSRHEEMTGLLSL